MKQLAQKIKKAIQNEKAAIAELLIIILGLFVFSQLHLALATGIDDGLVAYYHMDEGYGTVLNDETAYGNDGTIAGASWVTGRFGKALGFSIIDKAVTSADSSLNFSSGNFAFFTWIKPSNVDTNKYQIFHRELDGLDLRIDLSVYNGKLDVLVSNGTVYFSDGSTSLTANTWFHVGVQRDSTTFTIYLNGVADGSLTGISGDTANTDVTIGNAYDAYPFNGVIDEFRIYNRALSTAEIGDLYAYRPYEYPEIPETETLSYYFTSDLHTVNGVTGYTITDTAPDTLANLTYASVGSSDASFGFRVYLQTETESTELTSGTPTATATRTSAGAGYQTATLSISQTSMRFGYAMLKVVAYSRWNSSDWTSHATFTTDLLFYTRVLASTWTFQIYTNLTEAGGNTHWEMKFGDGTHETGISNVLFKQPNDPDWQNYYLQQGKPLDFLNFGLTSRVGNAMYALIAAAFCVTLHVRYKNTGLLLMVLILFGGAGGIFNLLIGDAVLGVVWLIATFSLAALFYKVFR